MAPGRAGRSFTITDPDLHLNQLEQVQHDVAHLLEHGLNPPVAEAAASVAAEPGNAMEPAAATGEVAAVAEPTPTN